MKKRDIRTNKMKKNVVILAIIFSTLAHVSLHADIASVNASPNTQGAYPAIHLVDGDDTTSWKLTPGSASGWAELALSGSELVYGVYLTGAIVGDNRLVIEYRHEGSWVPFTCAYFATGTFQHELIDLSYDEAVTDGIRLRLAGADCSQSGIAEIGMISRDPSRYYHKLAIESVTPSLGFPAVTSADNLTDGEVSTYWHCVTSYLGDTCSEEIRNLVDTLMAQHPAITNINAEFDFSEEVNCGLVKFYLEKSATGSVVLSVFRDGSWQTVSTIVNPERSGWYGIPLDGSGIAKARLQLTDQLSVTSGIGEAEFWGTGAYEGSDKQPLLTDAGTTFATPVTLPFGKQGKETLSLEISVQGEHSSGMIVDMNGEQTTVQPRMIINGNTLYVEELADEDLHAGENFLTLRPGMTVVSAQVTSRDDKGRVGKITGALGDGLYLQSVQMQPEESIVFDDVVSCEAFAIHTNEETPPLIDLLTDSGDFRLDLVKSGNAWEAIVNGVEAHGVKITGGGYGACEIEILGSKMKPAGPEIQLLWPLPDAPNALLSLLRGILLVHVSDTAATVTVNGIQANHFNHFFWVSYAALGIVAGEQQSIEIRATDAQGHTNTYALTMIVIPQGVLIVDQPDQVIYTTNDSITLSGRLILTNNRLLVNGVETTLTVNRFTAQVPVSEGFNLITLEVYSKTDNTLRERTTRRAIRTGDISIAIDTPADGTVTNRTGMEVSGSLSGWGPFTVTVNGIQTAVSGNTFFVGSIPLAEGSNTITVVATDTTGHNAQAILTITRDTTPPVVSGVQPTDGYMTTAGAVTVSGNVSDIHAAYVLVNGKTANLSGSAFSLAVALPEDGTHTITIAAFDAAGNKSIDHVFTVIRDTTPPDGFGITIDPPFWTNDTTPTLTFNTTDSLTGVVRYELSVGGGAATTIISPYTLQPQPNGFRSITVRAYNGAGLSTTASGSIFIDTIPSDPPEDFLAVANATSNKLTWTDDKDENAGYIVYRNPQFAEYEYVHVLRTTENPAANHYSDSDVTPGSTYGYRIQTMDKAGNLGVLSPIQIVKTGIEEEAIGSEGGTARFDNVVIEVGENVFDEGDKLVIEQRQTPLPENEFATDLGKVYSIKRINSSGEVVTGEFTEPVSMTLDYRDTVIPAGYDAGNLGMYLWVEEGQYWEKLRGVTNDYFNRTLTLDLRHFSDYAPMAGSYTQPDLAEYEKLGVNPYSDYFANTSESVSSSSGSLSVEAVDVQIPGKDGLDLVLARSYSSSDAEQYALIEGDINAPPKTPPIPDDKKKKHTEPVKTFGQGWSLNIPMVETTEEGKFVRLPEGQKIKAEFSGNTFEYHKGVHFTLRSISDGTYTLTMIDGTVYEFDANGRPTKKTSPSQKQSITYTYATPAPTATPTWVPFPTSTSTPASKELSKITDSFGNEITFSYNPDGLIDTIVVPAIDGTATHKYEYNENKCLKAYTDPKDRTTLYEYELHENVKIGVKYNITISGRSWYIKGYICPPDADGYLYKCEPVKEWYDYSGSASADTKMDIDLIILNKITYPTGGISSYEYDLRPYEFMKSWDYYSSQYERRYGEFDFDSYKLFIVNSKREGKTTEYTYNTNTPHEPIPYSSPEAIDIVPPDTYIYGCTINDGQKVIEEKYNLLFGNTLFTDWRNVRPGIPFVSLENLSGEYYGNMLVERTIKDKLDVPLEKIEYMYNLPIRAVTRETHNHGTVVTYIMDTTYDGWGNLTETIDSRTEKKVTATFKPHGRIRSLPDTITEYNKNPLTNITTELSTRYIYSEENTDYSMGKPTRIEVTGGSSQRITEYDYDDNGLILTVTNKAKETGGSTEETGLVTKFEYIDYDNTSAESFTIRKILFGIKDPDENNIGNVTYEGLTGGIATKSQYDKGTVLLTNEWDAVGNEKQYDYDILKRLINVTVVGAGPSGEDITRQNVFHDADNKSEYINERGYAATFYYSNLGQLTKVVPPSEEGQTGNDFATTYVYDAWGRITDAIKPAPDNVGASVVTTSCEYDSFNRIIKMVYPDMTFVTLQYDDATNTVSVYDQYNNLIAEETNDYAGRLVKAIQHNQYASESETLYEWRFNYDSNGRKIRQIDPAGYTTEQNFDAFGKPVQATMPYVEAVVPGVATPQGMNPVQSAVYDKWGNKVKELSANGNATNLANKNNYGVEHEYDVLGREILTRTIATNPENEEVESVYKIYYDKRGNKVRVIDGNGEAWLYAYDKRNLLVSETDPEGRTTAYTYDKKENKVSVTDPRGTATTTIADDYTTWYEYDRRDRLVKTILPDNTPATNTDNPYTTSKYDKAGNKTEEKDADGVKTKYTYTLKNQVETKGIISKNGDERTLVTYAYDNKGNLTSEIDNNEHTTSYAYDRLVRLRKVTYPDESSEEYTYDKLGNKLTVKDRRGNTITTTYNSLGWVTRITDPMLEVTKYEFDPNGNNVKLTKPNGLEYKSVYDEQNRIVKAIDSIGQMETVSYDGNGNIVKKTDVRDTVWEYLYDDSNMLEHIYANKQTDGTSDYHCAYTYDAAGNKLSETDDVNVIEYTPNELNQITHVTKRFASVQYTMDYGYTLGGLLTSIIYPGATEPVTYTYDSYNSLKEVVGFTQPDSIGYDDMFNLTGYATVNGNTTALTYDANDRLKTLAVGTPTNAVMSFDYTHDPAGNITAIKDALTNKIREYQYDAINKLKNAYVPVSKMEEERTPGEAGIVDKDYEGKKALDYGIDPTARISVDYNSRSIGIKFSETAHIKKLEMMPEALITTHRIENRNFDIYTSNDNGTYTLVPKSSYAYTKDEHGKITILFNERLTTLFLKIHVLFDDRDRSFTPTNQAEFINTLASILTVYQESEYVNEWFAYDENGNRIRRDLTLVRTFTENSNYYPNTERLKIDGNWIYTYDEAGNIVEKGNTVKINSTPYSVKSEEAVNYLGTVNISIGSVAFVKTGDEVEYWKYTYDLLNRLVKVEKNNVEKAQYTYDPDGYRTIKRIDGNTIHEVYQGNKLIFEKNVTTGEKRSYVYAFGKYLARVDGAVDSTTAERYYYSTDNIGSVRVVTDKTGEVVWKGEYSAFGELITEERADQGFDADIIYAGHKLDDENGLYYAKMRYYDASTGRFTSIDPIRDGLNWYVYAGNNPIIYADPTGLGHYVPGTGYVEDLVPIVTQQLPKWLEDMMPRLQAAWENSPRVREAVQEYKTISAVDGPYTAADCIAVLVFTGIIAYADAELIIKIHENDVKIADLENKLATARYFEGEAKKERDILVSTVNKIYNAAGYTYENGKFYNNKGDEVSEKEANEKVKDYYKENAKRDKSSEKNAIRIQVQTGKLTPATTGLIAGDTIIGVLKAQGYAGLAALYNQIAEQNPKLAKSEEFRTALIKMSVNIKKTQGIVQGGNVFREEFIYNGQLYRIDLENLRGVNLKH